MTTNAHLTPPLPKAKADYLRGGMAHVKGWIAPSWELSEKGKRARFYRLTSLGRKQLAAERSKWDAFARAMALILNPVDQGAQ